MKQNLLKTMLVGIAVLAGTVGAMAEDSYTEIYSRTTEYGANNIWTENDIADWGGNSNLQLSVPTEAGSTDSYHGLWFNTTKPGSSYSATKSFDVTDNAKVKYEINWYFANSTGRTSNFEYIQIGDKIRFSYTSDYKLYLTTDGTSSQSGTVVLSGKGSYTKKIIAIINTATKSVESLSFDGTDYTEKMPATLDGSLNSISFGFVRGGATSNWAYPNGIQDITVSQCEQQVSTADYTINYNCDGSTVNTEKATGTVEQTITAKSVVYDKDSIRYLIVDETAPSITLASSNNVLNVNVRKPYSATLTVTTNIAGIDSIVTTKLEETDDKSCAYSYVYSLYTKKDGVYYIADNTETFGETGTFSDGETIEKTVKYSNADPDVLFFHEAEGTTVGSNTEYSGGAKGVVSAQNKRNRGISAGTFEAGTYNFIAAITANNKRSLVVREKTADDGAADSEIFATLNSETQEAEFTLTESKELVINGANSGTEKTNQSEDFDYVVIKKVSVPSGISSVSIPNATSQIYYNLSGQRISQPVKGLYIVNGKKVVIR